MFQINVENFSIVEEKIIERSNVTINDYLNDKYNNQVDAEKFIEKILKEKKYKN